MSRAPVRAIAILLALGAAPLAAVRLAGEPPAPADLVFVSGPEPETLDPALATAVLETRLLGALFEGLVSLDPATLAPRLAAAERHEVDRDGRHVFQLREGLAFSDGSPLSAGDFLYAWRRAADPRTGAPLAAEVALVSGGARALDARTIEIALDPPRADLLALLTLPIFLPVSRAAVEAHGERWTRPGNLVSNGPFRLAAWELGRRIRLERNERYRARARVGLASIEAITTSGAAPGDGTAFQIYETGGADLIFALPAGAAMALRGRPDFHAGPALRTTFLRFNCERGPLANPAIRRALADAIDREGICARVLRNGERPAHSLVPPGLGGSDALPRSDAAPPAERRALGARGSTFEILYAAEDESAAHMAEVIQAGWGERLDVRARLRPMERKAFYGAVRRREYEVAFGSWVADYPDPANFLEILRGNSGNNRTGWRSAEYDALLDRAARAGGEARARHLREAEAILRREAPIAPLAYGTAAVLCRERVAGFVPNPLNFVAWADLRIAARAERGR